MSALAVVPSSSRRRPRSGRRKARVATPATPASSSPAHSTTTSPAEAATITPNTASSGMARLIDGESSAAQSAAPIATNAASRAAAFTNKANRSSTSPPLKYVATAAPAHSSTPSAMSSTTATAAGSRIR